MPSQSPDAGPQAVDVAIVGGGIAGGALAIVLKRAGLNIALIERERVYRDRIRGEAVHPWGVREINALGVRSLLDAAGAIELPFWTKYRDALPATPYAWQEDFPDSPGAISVNHVRLQTILLQGARDEGVHVFQPATVALQRVRDGWNLAIPTDVGEEHLFAHLLVGADGQRSATRALLGATARRDPIHHHMGGALVRGVDLPRDSAHQAFHDSGFSMTYLQEEDLARVYLVCPSDEAATMQGPSGQDAFLRRVASLYPEGAFARTEIIGPVGFFPNADIVSDRITAPGVVLIGDAAGANDPSQGHGLSLVFRDIRVLRNLLTTEDVDSVPEQFAAARMGYYSVLREHARWAAPLATDTGPLADELRDQVRRAREIDPSAGGFAGIFATGPDGLRTDDNARAHFFGEDIPGASIFGTMSSMENQYIPTSAHKE